MERTAANGVIQSVRYTASSAAAGTFDGEATVTASCMPDPQFKPIDTLAFFAKEQVMVNTAVADKVTTLQAEITPGKEEYLQLIDETRTKKAYTPLQFHLHAPSEHTFNGKHYDLELHIVHKNADASTLSVIGVFFDRAAGGTKDNEFIT